VRLLAPTRRRGGFGRLLDADLELALDALLAAHPELLTRASTAANMHGGVDPITGKSY
jgi:hypothetical protein